MVAGGLELTSYTTRFTPRTLLTLPKDGIQGLVYVLAGVIGRDDNRDLHFSRLKTSCFWVLLKQTR